MQLKSLMITMGTVLYGCILLQAQQKEVSDVQKRAANNTFYKGNEAYRHDNYEEASKMYQEGLKQDPSSFAGSFNNSNTQYNLNKTQEAKSGYVNSLNNARTKEERAKAYYNIGNTYMKQQQWKEAVEAYKQALRNNPADQDTKYNLAYALKKMQQPPQKNNKDKEPNKNEKDQGRNNPDQDQKDPKKENKDEGDNEQDQHPPLQSKISRQQAEQILNGLRQEEKQLMQERKPNEKGGGGGNDKDW